MIIKSASRSLGLEPEYTPFFGTYEKKVQTSIEDIDIGTLYSVIKKSPEVVASINALVEDVLSDGWKFEGSKAPIKDAEEFIKETRFFKIMVNALFDLFTTGNAYILKLAVKEENIKRALEKISQQEVMEKFGFSRKDVKEKIFFELKKRGITKPKDLQLLKSGTTTIEYDKHGRVEKYKQEVGNERIFFDPQDVIHLSLTNIGGAVYGFTPLETLLSDIGTLIFAKEYAGKYFENDGVPNFLINMPEAMGEEDRNFQVLKQQMKELKKKENKWRTLITTGVTNIEQIKPFDQDMQYNELIRHFTKIVFMCLGVPAHRVNFIDEDIKQSNQLRAYEGYFKKINFLQKILEESLNAELFDNFGKIKFVFNRSYKIDELREANIISILADRQLITEEEARKMMGMEEEKKGKEINTRGKDRDTRALRGEDTRRLEEEELSENKPNKPDNKVSNINKDLTDVIDINFDNFVRMIERIMPFQKANVLYIETPQSFIMFFHDGKWKYRALVNKNTVNTEEFKFQYLNNATRITP